jgi:hypothetical protein
VQIDNQESLHRVAEFHLELDRHMFADIAVTVIGSHRGGASENCLGERMDQ